MGTRIQQNAMTICIDQRRKSLDLVRPTISVLYRNEE